MDGDRFSEQVDHPVDDKFLWRGHNCTVPSALDNPIWRTYVSPYAAELLPRVKELAEAFTDVIHRRVPEVGNDPVLAATTRASAEANLTLALTMIRDGVPAEVASPPAAAVAQAREYVVAGAEVASLHRTYRIGHESFWMLFVVPLRERIADPDELTAAASLATEFTFQYIDAISTQIMEIFTAERERWVRSAAALRGDTVRGILTRGIGDSATASRRLGYDLDGAHLAFVVWADPTEQDVLALLEERGARVAAALGARRSLLVPLGSLTIGGWVAIAPGRDVSVVQVDLQSYEVRVRAAIGCIGVGLEGFRMSHQQATEARRIAEVIDAPRPDLEYYDQIAVTALMTRDPGLARAFVRHELGPLAEHDRTAVRLAETVAAYLAEGSSPARAGKRLGIHENTVANRIARAERLLGHSVESRRLELGIALRILPTIRALE